MLLELRSLLKTRHAMISARSIGEFVDENASLLNDVLFYRVSCAWFSEVTFK